MENVVSILLIDDHTIVRQGMKLILEHQNLFTPLIFEAENGEQALKMMLKKKYDLVVLDLCMPKMDGLRVLQNFKKSNSKQPILIVTSFNDESKVMIALDLGATGYLLKNSGSDEFLKAVNTVLKGERYYSNEVAQIILNVSKKEKQKNIEFDCLSKREKEVLFLISRGSKNSQIAIELRISVRTVEHHRKNIRDKLCINSTAELIRFALSQVNDFEFNLIL